VNVKWIFCDASIFDFDDIGISMGDGPFGKSTPDDHADPSASTRT
jgi:hypothetical protein